MIVGTAVCPGAPFLIEGTAKMLAAQLSSVVDACSAALSRLPDADALLLLTSGSTGLVNTRPDRPDWREFPPGTLISTSPVRRSDLPDDPAVALPSGRGSGPSQVPSSTVATMAVGTMVGASLISAVGTELKIFGGSAVHRWPPTTAIEITGNPADVAEMLADRVHSAQRFALLVIADGSACHGDDAPGRRDDRAASFDAALAEALAAGDPDALRAAAADRDLGRALQASIDPLAVLGLLTMQRPPTTADLLFAGAPLGVGYLVASWRWAAG